MHELNNKVQKQEISGSQKYVYSVGVLFFAFILSTKAVVWNKACKNLSLTSKLQV
jgi:hypothetical protein